ncbi:hypothetical protein SNE40_002563 [Patella caerulea]|uniref:Uncharacterized protein n=1 Tax=Patella caerulea TaxID=87958 RepID=A0AAN8KC34_PATCE
MQLFADALSKKGILSTDSLHDIVKQSSCSTESYNCMYGLCEVCNDPHVLAEKGQYDVNEEMSYKQWRTKKEQRTIRSEVKEVTITVKEECI